MATEQPPKNSSSDSKPASQRATIADLIAQLTHLGFAPDVASTICQSFVDNLQKALVRGEEVRLRGFGVLRRTKRKKRKPQPESSTTDTEQKPGYSYSVRFRPSRRLIGLLHGVDIPPTGAYKAFQGKDFPSLEESLLEFLNVATETKRAKPRKKTSRKPIVPEEDSVPQVLPSITLMPAHMSMVKTGEIVFELPPLEPAEPEPEVLPEIGFDLPPIPEETDPSFSPETTLRMGSAPPPPGYVPPTLEEELPPEEDLEDNVRLMPPTIEDLEAVEGVDFETHYNLGISYKEMGLYDQAIRELQRAIQNVSPTDEDGRYMNCCSLLGMCYREKQIYPQSMDWFKHALTVCKVSEPSYLALKYELGLTCEMAGQLDQALQIFSEVYAIDINFRSVTEKIKYLQSEAIVRQERMQKVIPVKVRCLNAHGRKVEEETWIVNISRRGAGLKTNYDHEVGTVIEVDFLHANRRHLGRVMWCAQSKDSDSTYRMGILLYNDSELGVSNWPPPLAQE